MEEAVQMVGTAARTGVEITAELLKILAPALAKGGIKILGTGGKLLGFGIGKAADAISYANAEGTVSRKHLFAEAAKAKTEVKCTDNYPTEAVERMTEMAKKYKIPISVNGEGANRSISYLERDRDAIAQIMQDWQMERLAPRADRQGVTAFVVNDQRNLGAIKSQFEQNGVECWFTQNQNGEIRCNFKSEDLEKAKIVSENFKKTQGEIAEHCNIVANIPENARQADLRMQIEQLENAVPSAETYDNILADMEKSGVEFPKYSENNMRIIKREMPDAKQIAGKAFWEQQGYKLNENAKGVEIVAPQMNDNGNPVLDENGKQTFTTTTVYDISETNAYEKTVQPKIDELRAEYDAEKAKAFAAAENKTVTVSNETNGKSVEINVDSKLRRSDVEDILREELGYSSVQAELAANKFGAELGLSDKFYTDHTQAENLDKIQVNIRYSSDDITIRDISFSAVKLSDGENVRLNIANGDNSVLIVPADMSDEELKTVFKEQLGMSEIQAEKAVEKSRRIDTQIQSKLRETVYDRDETQRTVNIERTSQTSFVVTTGEKNKVYDFSQIDLEKKIAEDFGIPAQNAHNIVQKAKNQSVVQNKIRANAEKKRKSDKLKNDPLKARDTGARKVKR